MTRSRARRLLLSTLPLALLAVLALGFAYAPAPTPARRVPATRPRDNARPQSRRGAAARVASIHSATATVLSFTVRTPSRAGTVADSPDLDERAPSGAVTGPTRASIAAATRSARTFLAGYLPYSDDELNARLIPDATSALRGTLASQPATIAPAEQRSYPRLLALGVSGGRAGQAALLASVADGRETYAVAVTVTRQPGGRWLVSAVW